MESGQSLNGNGYTCDQQEIESLRKTIGLVGVQYRRHLDALARSLTAIFQPTNQLAAGSSSLECFLSTLTKADWPTLQKGMERGCERLANLGWTLPISFTLQQVAELSQCADTDRGLEQYMFSYFTSENGRFYQYLRSYVLRAKNLKGWRALLEQCFHAYDRGHYLVPIPALLSVIEGAMAENVGRLKAKDKDPKPYAADLKKRAQRGSVEFLIWHSTEAVLNKLWVRCRFDAPHPGQLNRQWIMHGRDQTQWTQTDTLRLFNLLGTIS